MEWTSLHLDSLLAVARATFDDSGILLEANLGFLRLLEDSGPHTDRSNVARFLVQPDFAALLGAPASESGEVFRGRLTIGNYDGKTRTLRGTVWRDGAHFHLLAEHDIVELEFVQNIVLDMNRDYANAQFQLAQMNLNIERVNSELDKKVAERTRELMDALSLAEAASSAKSIFLATMSHEMLTPMHGIMGLANLALRRATDSRQTEHLGELKRVSQQLLDTIKNVLAIANLESHRLTLEPSVFKLGTVLESIKNLREPEATAKGLRLTITAPPDVKNQDVFGDPERLHQILQNMVGNAIKFTAQGCIEINVFPVMETPAETQLRFEIIDTGIGIAPEHRQCIFNAFQQVDGSSTRQYGGSGLGLAICKLLVKLMEGEIGVESTVGTGSIFWFKIRLKKQSHLNKTTEDAGKCDSTKSN